MIESRGSSLLLDLIRKDAESAPVIVTDEISIVHGARKMSEVLSASQNEMESPVNNSVFEKLSGIGSTVTERSITITLPLTKVILSWAFVLPGFRGEKPT